MFICAVKEYGEASLEEVNELVENADLGNPDIAAAAYEIAAQKSYSEEVPSGGSGAPAPSTTAATVTTTTSSSGQTLTTSGGSS